MKINGKTVWITGASSGIGEALAEELFRCGATVILSARNSTKLNEKKVCFDEIEKDRCLVLPFDISRPDEIEQALNYIKNMVKKVDILINNAGVSQRSLAMDTTIEVDRQIFEINFFGPVKITKGILPLMINSGGGQIVVISSMAGKFGFRMRSAYAASKHALHGFFETIRAELFDKNIKVTLICPGRINTNISVNSLTGDGSVYGIMDEGQLNGVPVKKCAQIITRAIEHGRKEVFIGGKELFLLALKRAFPSLYYYLVNRISAT
jgi:short-subunit dehydrogenase